MTKFICISGKARHGKDTVGHMLEKRLKREGYKVLVTHYADLVKYICTTFFNWDGEKDARGRSLLQYVGTDKVRAYDPNYWVNFILSIINVFGDMWDYVIIPDVRFPNEIDEITRAGYQVSHIKVVRCDFDDGLTGEQRNHQSETAMDKITPDYLVLNNGLDSLEYTVARLYPEIIKLFEGG